jgi:hypothetical protein
MSHCHFLHHKLHTDWLRIEFAPENGDEESANNRLRHSKTHSDVQSSFTGRTELDKKKNCRTLWDLWFRASATVNKKDTHTLYCALRNQYRRQLQAESYDVRCTLHYTHDNWIDCSYSKIGDSTKHLHCLLLYVTSQFIVVLPHN